MSRPLLRSGFAAGVVVCALSSVTQAGILPPVLPSGGEKFSDILDPAGPYKGSFIVADKLFEIVAFTPVGATIMPSMIDIVPVSFGLPATGFDLQGQFSDVPGDGLTSGFTLQYNVTVLDPSKKIVDVNLLFNGTAVGQNSAITLKETIVDPLTANFLDQLDVFAFGDTPMSEWRMADGVDFGPPGFTKLNIVKDFSVFAGMTGNANASFIRQTFSQIPAPGVMCLAALGIGFGARRRR